MLFAPMYRPETRLLVVDPEEFDILLYEVGAIEALLKTPIATQAKDEAIENGCVHVNFFECIHRTTKLRPTSKCTLLIGGLDQ